MSEKTPYTLVLGGTKGLGKAIAEQCMERGERVIVMGRSTNSTHGLDTDWRDPPKLLKSFIDLGGEGDTLDGLDRLSKLVRNHELTIDKIYWVSGAIERKTLPEMGWLAIKHLIDVNLRNPLMLIEWWMRLFIPHLDRAQLVIVSSTTGLADSPREDESVYAATKAAQVSLTRAVGKGNKSDKLKVALFCPGGMQTEFWRKEPGVDTSTFLDPQKVAKAIVEDVFKQTDPYYERVIPRGSL